MIAPHSSEKEKVRSCDYFLYISFSSDIPTDSLDRQPDRLLATAREMRPSAKLSKRHSSESKKKEIEEK